MMIPNRKVAAKFTLEELARVMVFHQTKSKVVSTICFQVGTDEDGVPIHVDIEITPKLTQVLACELMGAVARHIRMGSLTDDDHLSIGTREAVAVLEKEHGKYRFGYSNI